MLCNQQALLEQRFEDVVEIQSYTQVRQAFTGKEYEGVPSHYSLVYLALFGLMAISSQSFKEKIKELFGAFVSNRFTSQLIRENNILKGGLVFYILVLSSAILSLVYIQVIRRNTLLSSGAEDSIFLLLLFFVGIMALLLFKALVSSMVLNFFNASNESEEYLFNYFNFILMLSLFEYPLLLLHTYSSFVWQDYLTYSIVGVAALVWLFGVLRIFIVARETYRHKTLHIILYLCTLEILPILIIGKGILT